MKIFILLMSFISFFSININAQKYPEMVLVQGGSFTMGDEFGVGDVDERPLHEVTLKNYRIAKTETTVAQWKVFCKATHQQMPKAPQGGWKDEHPIANINWNDAVEYCKWLSKKMGILYRLPTEAEWEYAARGGNKSKGYKYSGSQTPDAVGWYDYIQGDGTREVVRKQPNELGIYDMSGNVWEWCSDWYNYYDSVPSVNPEGPKKGVSHVLRGGSWGYPAIDSRITSRYVNSPLYNTVYPYDGFRVASSE